MGDKKNSILRNSALNTYAYKYYGYAIPNDALSVQYKWKQRLMKLILINLFLCVNVKRTKKIETVNFKPFFIPQRLLVIAVPFDLLSRWTGNGNQHIQRKYLKYFTRRIMNSRAFFPPCVCVNLRDVCWYECLCICDAYEMYRHSCLGISSWIHLPFYTAYVRAMPTL